MSDIHIEIKVPHPTRSWWITMLCLVTVGSVVGMEWNRGEGMGGQSMTHAQLIKESEQETAESVLERQVLARKRHILEEQVRLLERKIEENPSLAKELAASVDELKELIQSEQRAERAIRASLYELWEAQGIARRASLASTTGYIPMLQWPVEPQLGISAYFDDAGYQERFGIPHKAIDIPEDQGSPVRAAADGIVIKVSDRGMGFNALTIQHGGGLSTLYGHVSEFFVEEGQEVYAGEVVARSGGTPKTPGAGLLTTGPHLHFEALLDGEHVDPLEYLIAHPMVGAAGLEGGGGGGEEGWEGGTEEGTTEGAD